MNNRRFCCYFFFVGWDCISIGLHVCISKPNIEIHLPFGFIRIGWCDIFGGSWEEKSKHVFGYEPSN